MSEFVVHTIPGSPFARAVFATLEEKGARYRIAPLAPGAHKSPEHLARHPFGRARASAWGLHALRNPGDGVISTASAGPV
jgi:hypothetical protein